MARLHTRVETFAEVPVLVVDGDVDMLGTPELRDALTGAVDARRGRILVVDLDAVESFDDLALGALLGAAGRARAAGGDIAIVCAGDRLRARMALTGFDRAVTVHSSTSAVIAAMRDRGRRPADSTQPADRLDRG